MKKENIILIEKLVADAKTEDAIIEFQRLSLDKDEEKTLILLKSRINLLKGDDLRGTIEKGDYRRGVVQISAGVLDLLDDFIKKRNLNNNIKFENETIYDPISKQKKIGYFAKQFYEQGEYGILRQKAVLSSFAMPNREATDAIWNLRDEVKRRDSSHFEGSFTERKWLEKHVTMAYTKLIIQPAKAIDIAQRRGKNAGLLRLKCLLEFLQANRDRVDVVITNDFQKESLMILGDWFYTYSNKPTDYGFENTLFEWQKELVQEQINNFEIEFNNLLQKRGLDVYDAKSEVIDQVKFLIREISKY